MQVLLGGKLSIKNEILGFIKGELKSFINNGGTFIFNGEPANSLEPIIREINKETINNEELFAIFSFLTGKNASYYHHQTLINSTRLNNNIFTGKALNETAPDMKVVFYTEYEFLKAL